MTLTAWLVAPALPASANDALEIRLRPTTGLGPLDVVVQLIVQPDERNRSVEVVLDSASYFASSTWELDGHRAPRIKDLRYRQLPPGEYDVRVTLTGELGTRASITRQLLGL